MKDRSSNAPYWPVFPSALILAGIIVFIFATFGPPASSSGFVSTIKGILSWVAPEYASEKAHYAMLPGPGSWLFTFVAGMALGGFLGGRTLGRPIRDVPEIWTRRFGPSRTKRYASCFAGGFAILFASRLAGGCTLGLFMSGSIQMAVSGLYFGILIFAFAMLSARLVYTPRNKEASHD